jgi:hypothetical protein
MSGRRLAWGALCAAFLLVGCLFRPDWSAYPRCDEGGGCPEGTLCWPGENLCLPRCGEGPCLDGGADGGGEAPDAGPDAGGPLRLQGGLLPPAVEAEEVLLPVAPEGGTPPYQLEVVDGGLPPGMFLSGDTLQGTPLLPGVFDFTLRVEDSQTPPAIARADFSLRVVALLRIGSQFNLTDADTGQPYQETLYATGGSDAGLLWSLTGGALPSGLNLNPATGTISGNTTESATFIVTVADTGAAAQRRSGPLHIESVNLGVVLHIRNRSLPHGRVGVAYDQRLWSGGGTGTTAWSVTGGELPPGLALQLDRIAGTPTQRGEYTVTLRVTDTTVGTHSRTFSFTIH